MKLQNKKTGDIGVLNVSNSKYHVIAYGLPLCGNSVLGEYDTLDALMQEWQDYEEPKKFWYICGFEVMPAIEGKFSTPDLAAFTREEIAKLEDIGNYFETEKEAEKAVEKLKAWKRLKDKGFEFVGYRYGGSAVPLVEFTYESGAEKQDQFKKDLTLLFWR